MNDAIPQIDFPKLYLLKYVNIFDNRIALFESLEGLDLEQHPHRIPTATLVLCKSGSCRGTLDQQKYEFEAGNATIILPEQILHIEYASSDFVPLCISASKKSVTKVDSQIHHLRKFILQTRNYVLRDLKPEEFGQLLSSYGLIKRKFEICRKNACHQMMLENMVVSIFFECFGFMQKYNDLEGEFTKKEALFKDFIRLAADKHLQYHTSEYYATQLGVSAKYLAAVIEEVSGKSAKRWIDEYIILNAKVLLCSTNKSIQEIAEELNFPDQSFFGKYFKRIAGVSPKDYRNTRNRG